MSNKDLEILKVAENGCVVLRYKGDLLKIKPVNHDSVIDSEEITKININNIVGEILTVSCLVNRWGNILAEVNSDLKREKLRFEYWEAKTKEEIRKKLVAESKRPTIDEINSNLILHEEYVKRRENIIDYEKICEIVNSIYWASKDKSDKLNKLSLTIQREDLNSVYDSVCNGVQIINKTK